jgi:hypothetical protein
MIMDLIVFYQEYRAFSGISSNVPYEHYGTGLLLWPWLAQTSIDS